MLKWKLKRNLIFVNVKMKVKAKYNANIKWGGDDGCRNDIEKGLCIERIKWGVSMCKTNLLDGIK